MRLLVGGILILILGMVGSAEGGDDSQVTEIRTAVKKALPLLVSAARVSGEQRKCFTCHSQGLPVLTIVNAGAYGFEIDGEGIEHAVEHTLTHLKRGQSNYRNGIGQGGKADTAGMALWALDAAGHRRDEITDAVVDFLLQWNGDTPYWSAQSQRPPSEGSRFTSTFLALSGLDAYGYEGKEEAIVRRRMSARRWLSTTRPETTEDHVFRLRGLALSGAGEAKIAEAGKDLLALQRNGGGWAQLAKGKSDAYATGSALVALFDTGKVDASAESYRRGVEYLLGSQLKDGSWHVVTRSDPVQKFYDSGFPHGTDQFISCSATSWATWALLKALPRN